MEVQLVLLELFEISIKLLGSTLAYGLETEYQEKYKYEEEQRE